MRMLSMTRPLEGVAEATNFTGEVTATPAEGDVMATLPVVAATVMSSDCVATWPIEFQATGTTLCEPAGSDKDVFTELAVVLYTGWLST
jgi:hypothetical protein